MSKDLAFVEQFEAKLFELFPDAKTQGIVKNQELLDTMRALGTKKSPRWLMTNRVGRGLYAIDGSKTNVVVKETPVHSFTVDYTNMESLIPKRDSNYVPFGNHADGFGHPHRHRTKDIDTIITIFQGFFSSKLSVADSSS